MNITKDTKLVDIWEDGQVQKVLAEYDFPCLTCPFAQEEIKQLTLGIVCENYGIEVDKLLIALNKINK